MYLTPYELEELPLGLAVASQIATFGGGVIDKMLARASQRADSFCERRLQAPGSTTLSASANANTTTLSVNSTLTLDNLAEQAAIVDAGNSNQETRTIVAGGVNVTAWASPYPGTLTLESPLQFGHSSGAPVQYAYKEVNQAIAASQSDPYTEALQSQAAQLALAHLPPMHTGLTRIVFLNSYPVQTVTLVEHAYSFDTQYNVVFDSANPAFTGGIIIEPTAGYYRFRVGTVILPQGMVRSTYVGGYQYVPEDVKEAITFYVSDMFARLSNPYVATDMTQGKRKQTYALKDGKSPAVQAAEAILKKYRRCV